MGVKYVGTDEHGRPFIRPPDRSKALLSKRMGRVRENGKRALKKAFDIGR